MLEQEVDISLFPVLQVHPVEQIRKVLLEPLIHERAFARPKRIGLQVSRNVWGKEVHHEGFCHVRPGKDLFEEQVVVFGDFRHRSPQVFPVTWG